MYGDSPYTKSIVFVFLIFICTLLSGCIGKYVAAFGPPRTIIFRDTSTSLKQANSPAPCIRVHIFKDDREKREYLGRVYSNMGEHVKNLTIHDDRSLEKSITFIIADSLTRAKYDTVVGSEINNKQIDYDISGVIKDFEIIEKTTRITPTSKISHDGKFAQYAYHGDKHSRGYVYIVFNIHNNVSNKNYEKAIEVTSESDGITAQEMATILIADIVNKTNSAVYDIAYNGKVGPVQ